MLFLIERTSGIKNQTVNYFCNCCCRYQDGCIRKVLNCRVLFLQSKMLMKERSFSWNSVIFVVCMAFSASVVVWHFFRYDH